MNGFCRSHGSAGGSGRVTGRRGVRATQQELRCGGGGGRGGVRGRADCGRQGGGEALGSEGRAAAVGGADGGGEG